MSDANSTTIWERISKHKKPVVEPRQSSLFLSSIEDYMAKLKDSSSSGAIFFAVCRGKVSEGLDFADHAGRAVVVTGMPFATWNDPKVRLKRECLDEQAHSQRLVCKVQVLTGEDWYNQQASRAVNQAVGRVIRHRHDYGAIIFLDERFAQPNRQSQVSLWIRPHIKCYSKFGEVVFMLTRFFRDGEARGPTKLNLLTTEKQGQICESEVQQPSDKFYLDKFLSGNTEAGQDCPVKLSPLPDARRKKVSSLSGEIVPANRASVTCCKDQSVSWKGSNAVSGNEKKLLTHKRKGMQFQDRKVIDLTGESMLNEKWGEERITPCSVKKCKVSAQHDSAQPISNSMKHSYLTEDIETHGHLCPTSSIKSENSNRSRSSDRESTQNAQAGSKLLHKDSSVTSSPVPSDNEETRGSQFLVQVKEKLSVLEYKEFVDLMKALKSKAMNISEVLQSIARLFAGPERLLLLKRFKYFIPAKHHSMYEHHFQTNGSSQSEMHDKVCFS